MASPIHVVEDRIKRFKCSFKPVNGMLPREAGYAEYHSKRKAANTGTEHRYSDRAENTAGQ